MHSIRIPRGDACTFLTYLFGGGLDEDRYRVQRYKSCADGEILPRRRDMAAKKGRTVRETVSLRTVKQMRPERDEIIVCTGINRASSGVQYWGSLACGFFVTGNLR